VIDGLGWLATAVFAASYFLRERRALLKLQIAAALLWTGYGLLTGAAPVVVANGIVVAAAGASLWRGARPLQGPSSPRGPASSR
jgi:hypothetical protein